MCQPSPPPADGVNRHTVGPTIRDTAALSKATIKEVSGITTLNMIPETSLIVGGSSRIVGREECRLTPSAPGGEGCYMRLLLVLGRRAG